METGKANGAYASTANGEYVSSGMAATPKESKSLIIIEEEENAHEKLDSSWRDS